MSETIGKNLAAALLSAQLEIDGVSKDSKNPHYGSKFADLTSVIEATIPILNKHGIVVLQVPVPPSPHNAGFLALKTTLVHAASGEFYSGNAELPLGKMDPQGYGAALTYARRQSLGSFIGLKFKDDDDGETAVGRGNAGRKQAPRPGRLDAAEQSTDLPPRIEPPAKKPAGGGWGNKVKTTTPDGDVIEPAPKTTTKKPKGKLFPVPPLEQDANTNAGEESSEQ